ncbi:adenylate kinase [Halobacteriales archaeon QS_8_69_26]|nr:MAG: adenylate kinase [Halobacteriales archaeon QS_8_69_26]
MTVIATVGLPGSGKGEFAEVARDEGVPVVTMGDVVRQACRDRGLDPETHHGDVARQLREEDGETAIADRTIPPVREYLDSGADVVLVDGVRSGVEVERFEEAFGDSFVLVSVAAPFEQRAERLRDRGRDESDLTDEALRAREERELGFGMGEAIEMADATVENTAGLAEYRDRVRSILRDPEAALEGVDPVGAEDGR